MRLQQFFPGAFLLVLLWSGPAYGSMSSMAVLRSEPAMRSFGRQKTVTVSIRNDSGETVELRNGKDLMKLERGKTVTVKLPIGARILFETASARHAQGDVLVDASSNLNDATVVIH